MFPKSIARRLFTVLMLLLAGAPAAAQDLQRIAAIVNDEVISSLDVQRRLELVMISTGLRDTSEVRRRLEPQVLRSLIDERLQFQEATRRNVAVTEADVARAFAQLERQNGIPPGRIDDYLRSRGISKEALIQQLRAEIAWGKLIRSRIAPTILIGDDEVRAALNRIRSSAGQSEDLVAEIFVAVDAPDQDEEARRTAVRLIEQIGAGAPFAAVARQFSQGVTAAAGGEVGWVQPGTLPEEIDAALKRMNKGDVSEPIRAPGGYYIIQLRDRRRVTPGAAAEAQVTLKQVMLPLPAGGGEREVAATIERARAAAQEIRGCDDVERVGQHVGAPQSGSLGTVRLSDLPAPFRDAVAALGAGQVSQPVRSPQGVHLLVVCERRDAGGQGGPDPEQLRQRLAESRVSMLARRYLRDLRRDAVVEIR
jgi:peptidyl-prolyl cis-trans isomerase SurA